MKVHLIQFCSCVRTTVAHRGESSAGVGLKEPSGAMAPTLRPMLRLLAAVAFLLGGVLAQAREHRLEVTGLPASAPLTVAASHDGELLRIVVDLKAGWHLYGRDVGGGQPVVVKITGGAFTAAEALRTPMDDKCLITGKATLELPLRRAGPGDALTATMGFMVCDALQCLPPIQLELRTSEAAVAAATEPFPVLLVAVDESERTQRIASFLRDHGFLPAVSTYATVTAAQCDVAAVVIADSPTHGQLRDTKAPVQSFPSTSTPIVAVGLLGTELLQANKVAMASGYI